MLAGVDVVRGPVANIYGSGAIGGVVSFRTKDIEDVVKAGERWGVLSTGMVGSNIFRDMASMFAGARVHPNVDVFGGIVYRHNQNYRDGDGKEWPNTGFDVASGDRQAEDAAGDWGTRSSSPASPTRPTTPPGSRTGRPTRCRSTTPRCRTGSSPRAIATAGRRTSCSISTATSIRPAP